MPSISAVNLRPLAARRVHRNRAVPSNTQAAPATPKAAFNCPCGAANQASTPAANARAAHGASSATGREACSRCQRVSGPKGSSATSGAINTTNKVPK